MLTPEYLSTLPDALVELWQQVEDDILRDIARRIGALDQLEPMTPTAQWQAWRLVQSRLVQRDVTALLAKYSGKTRAEIRRLLQDAGTQTLETDDEIYRAAGKSPAPVNDSPTLRNLLNAGYRQTLGTWQNLTATTANTVTGEFERALDRAWLQVSSGAFDYKTAIARAVDDLAAGGIKAITYPTGHRDTLEVAVRRCVLTGVNQTAAKLQLARMDEMDCAFVEVSAHAGARPEHAVWQGKVYHRGGAVVYNGIRYEDFETATGYGTGPGLCGWNCRHNFHPFFPGVSERNYTDQRLKELADPQKHEESQRRRALERRVRDAKRRYLAADAAGVDTGKAAARLRDANRALASFRQETGGKVDSARTSVWGFGRSEAGRATSAAERQERLEAANEELSYLRQDGIIRSKGSFVMPPKAPETLIFEREHVFQRIMERQLSFTDAEKIIANARFALRQQNGNLHAYYSDDGFVAVRSDGTVCSMGPLDEGGKKLMEVAKKHGF
ncbi:MAG: phage minor capsid protein [Gemmiger sp.]